MTHFPPFSFDLHDRTLWRGATEVPLTPKASDLLACLLDARGAWVSKEAILSTVWPDAHVQSDNIKVLVREIRQALGDSPLAPTYVRSFARRGYAFVAPIADVPRAATDGMVSSRRRVFVQREPEITALNAALNRPPDTTTPLVLIAGQNGVGKTALCDAFLRAVRKSGAARVCYGQCVQRELSQEPYFPIIDALIRLDREHPDLVPPRLAEHAPYWLSLFPQWRMFGRCRAAAVQRTVLDQLRLAVDAIAREVPLTIVIEDLQWADPDTVRALAHLVGSGAGSRATIVATCSEGAWSAGIRARARLDTGTAGCTTIALMPFTVGQVSQYVAARFGAGSIEALAPMVHAITGGNAMLVVAAFDGLVDRRMIARDARGWRRKSSTEAIGRVLPETWTDIVVPQLEQLETHEREAIEAAAAVGFEFALGTVAVALGKRSEDVGAVLAPLARREQLIVAGDPLGKP
jgi:DNA-binding winged helix-turn-helix (wHTH) protein